jgi:hypothetical protein
MGSPWIEIVEKVYNHSSAVHWQQQNPETDILECFHPYEQSKPQ